MKKCMNHRKSVELARTFKALGHPVRLQLVCGLLESQCNVKHMTECLGIPQAAVSQQLAVLRGAGVVECERKGNTVCYRVTRPWLRALVRSALRT
jgi:ArsR family transcriptional regulator